MPFLLIRNDITKVQADALVNPANEELLEGSGTSRGIYLAAGEDKLAAACAKIGHCELGKAVITPGFDLRAKYVIHAVGPVWIDGAHREEELLYGAYMSSMHLAQEYQLESIAFPLLSSGNYGYPKDQAMKVAIRAISDFLLEYDMMVYLVLYDRSAVAISKKLFASVEEYIDDHYVSKKDESIDDSDRRSGYIRREENYAEFVRRQNLPRPEQRQLADAGDWQSMEPASADIPADSIPAGKEPAGHAPVAAASMPGAAAGPLEEKTPQTKKKKLFSRREKRSLKNLMEHLDETFSQMLLRLIDERGLKDSAVYKKANIDRRHFSKIKNDINYAPNKKTVLAFAIALELSLDETKDLLMRAGFAFSSSSKFDVIICFFIENGEYDIFEINEVLFAYQQPLLGE